MYVYIIKSLKSKSALEYEEVSTKLLKISAPCLCYH